MSETARKPFNLQEALAGKPVVTRDGRKVLSITHLPTVRGPYSVFAHVEGDLHGKTFTMDGLLLEKMTEAHDLFMSVVEKTVWLNVYPDGYPGVGVMPVYFAHPTEKSADYSHNITHDHSRLGNKAHKITWIED